MKMSIWREMTRFAIDSPCTERETNYYLAEYFIQYLPKENKIEAFDDYVLVTYVDDTVLCSNHIRMN